MVDIFIPSTWRRLFAFFIDQFFIFFFYLPFAGTFSRIFFTDEDVYVSLIQLFVLFMVPAVYEFVFLMILQATPGKWLLGLKVVPAHNADAELHTFQCALRPLTSRLSFFFAWAIYALAFFRYDRTHLADWVAETRVIQFKPRAERPKIRWIIGSLLFVSYLFEGLNYSMAVLQQIDWKNHKVELRSVLQSTDMVDFDFGDDETED